MQSAKWFFREFLQRKYFGGEGVFTFCWDGVSFSKRKKTTPFELYHLEHEYVVLHTNCCSLWDFAAHRQLAAASFHSNVITRKLTDETVKNCSKRRWVCRISWCLYVSRSWKMYLAALVFPNRGRSRLGHCPPIFEGAALHFVFE